MKKPSVTKTNHILPFSELSPTQFERLCLWLVEHEGFAKAEHLGEAGTEQGRAVALRRGSGSSSGRFPTALGFHPPPESERL